MFPHKSSQLCLLKCNKIFWDLKKFLTPPFLEIGRNCQIIFGPSQEFKTPTDITNKKWREEFIIVC